MKLHRTLPVLLFSAAMFHPCTSLSAATHRNIFSFTTHNYSNAPLGRVYENAFIVKIAPATDFLLKIYRDDRQLWSNNIYTLGPVFILDKYHYMELTYGYGDDSGMGRSDYYDWEITREKPRRLSAIGFRHSATPGYHNNLISPSMKYYLTDRLSIWGKYFLSYGSNNDKDYALWTELEYTLLDKTKIKLGMTRGGRLYETEYGSGATGSFDSIIAGVSYEFNENSFIKYIYEDLDRQPIYSDKKNTLIIDFRF
ncbi:MAG: hypothetical protein AB1546_10780 [bacterium]